MGQDLPPMQSPLRGTTQMPMPGRRYPRSCPTLTWWMWLYLRRRISWWIAAKRTFPGLLKSGALGKVHLPFKFNYLPVLFFVEIIKLVYTDKCAGYFLCECSVSILNELLTVERG